jgi:flagellin-like protein
MERARAVAPVISTILMVAIAVVLAATISVFVLDLGESVEDPAPTVGQSTGTLVGGTDNDDQLVRITHVAGDNIAVEDMEIVVDAPACTPGKARLTNLPVESGSFDSENIEYGASLIDESGDGATGVIEESTQNTFESGEFFEFRLTSGACGGPGTGLQDGDTVTVRVVHTPSNAIIIDKRLRVTE